MLFGSLIVNLLICTLISENQGLEKSRSAKGQLILKSFFGIVDFLQKTNENTSHNSKNEFIHSFFGGNL